jgi:hypothetical protein
VSHRPEPRSKTGNDPSAAAAPKHRQFLPGAIKQLFRQLAKALTLTPAQQRRRRKDETQGGFKLAFHKIMRRIPRPETPPVEAARLWLADTLDWLQLWHEEPVTEPEPNNEPARPDALADDFSTDLQT